jgi:hypothetical protein
LWKIEGCKCKIGLRTNLKLIPKIQGSNYKSVKELNYDLILGNGVSVNEEYGKLGVVVDFHKVQGLSAKQRGIGLLRFIFLTNIGVDQVHNSVDWKGWFTMD